MVGNYGFISDPQFCEFNGRIDEIKIYNTVLTDEEIQSEYEEILLRCAPGTVIPTLGEIGMIILGLSICLSGIILLRRKNKRRRVA